MPKSTTETPEGSSRSSSRLRDRPPKPSSRIQALPTPATRICFSSSRAHCGHSTSTGREEEEAADLAHQLLARVVVDRDAEVDAAVVVEVDALDRRRPPVEHAVVGVAVALGPQHDRSPRRTTTPSTARARASPLARVRTGTRPVAAAVQLLGRRRRARARSSRAPPGPAAAISSRSASRERVHVQQQRLLDLGVVEQVAAALGRELRVVGQHDRGAEHGVVVGRGEHRPGVDVLAARRLERRDEAAAVARAAPGAWRSATCSSASLRCRRTSAWFSTRSVIAVADPARAPRPRASRSKPESRARSITPIPASLGLVPLAARLQEADVAATRAAPRPGTAPAGGRSAGSAA